MQPAESHSHDVSVIWYVWPFNVILWRPVQEFLQGYGLNFINDWVWIFTSWIIIPWNICGYFLGFFGLFDITMYILNWIPNTFVGGFVDFFVWPLKLIGYFI